MFAPNDPEPTHNLSNQVYTKVKEFPDQFVACNTENKNLFKTILKILLKTF